MSLRSELHDLVLARAESHGEAYSRPEVTVRGHRLPSDYWEVVRTVDGFVTGGGLFRLFRVEGRDGLQARNEAEWLRAYGHLVNGFVCVAEDIFGDLYGYVFDDAGESTLSKFFCEGGAFEACVPCDFGDFLTTRVLTEDPDAFDADLARAAWRRGSRLLEQPGGGDPGPAPANTWLSPFPSSSAANMTSTTWVWSRSRCTWVSSAS